MFRDDGPQATSGSQQPSRREFLNDLLQKKPVVPERRAKTVQKYAFEETEENSLIRWSDRR
jgi:hypothetical protein